MSEYLAVCRLASTRSCAISAAIRAIIAAGETRSGTTPDALKNDALKNAGTSIVLVERAPESGIAAIAIV